MATLLPSESRRLYSWWWDSHISPKNSKWLLENLTDIDSKVKAMIKLIEEDADSFARRAEMYYKKRPELLKLVEEFYRAYRALAERYDHAMGALRQAHRTMEAAFPNQFSFILAEDSYSGNDTEPHTPEMPHPIRALLEPDDLHKDAIEVSSSDLHDSRKNEPSERGSQAEFDKKGLKQLHEMFDAEVQQNSKFVEGRLIKGLNHEMDEKEPSLQIEVSQLSNENHNLKVKNLSESERASKAVSEVQGLKKVLADTNAEKAAVLLQYQQCIDKLSNMQGELSCAQEDCTRLNEQASKAETEVHSLKGVLVELENERDASIVKQKECLERISDLEGKVSQAQAKAAGLNERATKAEIESQYFKHELSRLESEKDAVSIKYKECQKRIADLESQISVAKEDSRLLNDRAGRAQTEVKKLEKAIAELTEEKIAASIQYEHCLEKISKLERELSFAQEDVKRLNHEVLKGDAKLKSVEEKCGHLKISNQSLQREADNLVTEISMKDQELSKKQEELEKLQTCLQDEHLRYVQVETTLKAVQDLHSQSQEEQRALALEFRTGLQMLKGFELHNLSLEEELQRVKDENQNLNDLNLSSTLSVKNLENEIRGMREMKERLEEEVLVQTSQSNALQKEICDLKAEIGALNRQYQALIEQLELAGLNPEFIFSSVKDLKDENLRLRQTYENDRDEKEALSKKLENVESILEKNAVLEISLSDVNGELQVSQEKVRELQESIQFLHGEKSALAAEKAALLSQLQIITEKMQVLLEKNAVLDNSLSLAKIELEGLREKSKGLEAVCQLLNDQKSNLLSERSTLALKLENVQERLLSLEKRFTGLEEKYAGLEKEKDLTHSEVKQLMVSLDTEKQERANCALQSETRLGGLENHIRILREASKWRKIEFEEELDKAVNAQFEIFILQKFIKDMEEKNYSLLIECQKQFEASKLTEKLISDLENENLEQQVEAELLLDEIEKLRLGICSVFKALEIGQDVGLKDKIENEQNFVPDILKSVEHMKCSLSECKDDNEELLVENSVLLILLGQLKSEGKEIESAKGNLDQEFKVMAEQFVMIQDEKQEILEMNRQLKSEVANVNQQAVVLEAELNNVCMKQDDLQRAYLKLQEDNARVWEEHGSLLKKISELKYEKSAVDEANDINVQEILALDNLSTIYKSFCTERAAELKSVYEDLVSLRRVKDELEMELSIFREKLEMKETENLLLKDSIQKLEVELNRASGINDYLAQEMSSQNILLSQRVAELMVTQQKVKNAENLNSDLCKYFEELKSEFEKSGNIRENLEKQILEMSEQDTCQNKEIAYLREENGNLKCELLALREEIEDRIIREESLNLELQEKDNEYELWEAEASTFYFDLQVSSIREVLFENKLGELAEVYETLEDKSVSKTAAIDKMKESMSVMEGEIGGLKAQLSAYAPVVASLKEDVDSLAQKALSLTKLDVTQHGLKEVSEVEAHPHGESCQEPEDDQKSLKPNGISDLQKLQAKIKVVERVVAEEMNRIKRRASLNRKLTLKETMREIQELKSGCSLGLEKEKEPKGLGNEFRGDVKLKRANPEISEVKNGTPMKDIPLDQVSGGSFCGTRRRNRRGSNGTDDLMLELWETAENCTFNQTVNKSEEQAHKPVKDPTVHHQSEDTESSQDPSYIELQVEKELGVDRLEVPTSVTKSNQEGYNRKILDRLASDAQRLASLHLSAQNLRSRLETDKKIKKARDVDIETVKEQLQEVEEMATQLADLNGQLKNNINDIPSSSDVNGSAELEEALSVHRKRVSEQARKMSERIGRLQLEVQKIQYILLKLEDEKRIKGRNRFSKSRTIVLRDFIYNGRRSGERRKKTPFCGCFKSSQPLSPRNGNNV